jgi:hypothetical protein
MDGRRRGKESAPLQEKRCESHRVWITTGACEKGFLRIGQAGIMFHPTHAVFRFPQERKVIPDFLGMSFKGKRNQQLDRLLSAR